MEITVYPQNCISLPPIAKIIWLAALLLGFAASSMAQSGSYINTAQYTLPASDDPYGIVMGPDGAFWYTEPNGNRIGRITAAGGVTEYQVPTAGSSPWGIAVGPDGAMWFTEGTGNKIGRINTSGKISEYQIPTSFSSPAGIAAGPDGAMWFAENNEYQIGRIDMRGAVTEYVVPGGPYPFQIAAGPDGAMWFTAFTYGVQVIGRITASGEVTRYSLPNPSSDSNPEGIAAGPDGALWFTENGANRIGRISLQGDLTEYDLPTKSFPTSIAAGTDGAVWFTGYYQVGRITTTGTITVYSTRIGHFIRGIAPGSFGLWFTGVYPSQIGHVPACGLGLSGNLADNSVTLNFDLGIDAPAIFRLEVRGAVTTKPIPPVVPPHAFSIEWGPIGSASRATVESSLSDPSGEVSCEEWTTVSTGQ